MGTGDGPSRDGGNAGARVLVVEDEFLIAMEIEDMLSRHGFRVLGPVPTVAQALAFLETETPDLALLDVNLRGERITPVAAELRGRGVPFVLASAYRQADLDDAPALAGVENVGKPIHEGRLIRALSAARAAHAGVVSLPGKPGRR